MQKAGNRIFTSFLMFMVFMIVYCTCRVSHALDKEVIASPSAPKAVGPYSQAIKIGNTLYFSGQIAINPETGNMITDSIEAETKQVLENLKSVLHEAGYSPHTLAETRGAI